MLCQHWKRAARRARAPAATGRGDAQGKSPADAQRPAPGTKRRPQAWTRPTKPALVVAALRKRAASRACLARRPARPKAGAPMEAALRPRKGPRTAKGGGSLLSPPVALCFRGGSAFVQGAPCGLARSPPLHPPASILVAPLLVVASAGQGDVLAPLRCHPKTAPPASAPLPAVSSAVSGLRLSFFPARRVRRPRG